MTFADALALALRNLRQAKLRTALTSMGVAIGIASLAGMVSLGVGLQEQVVNSFMRSGLFDTITVSAPPIVRFGRDGRGRGGPGRGPFGRGLPGGREGGRPAPDGPQRVLDDAALKQLQALPGVKHAAPSVRVQVQVSFDQETEFVAASGVPMFSKDDDAFQALAAGHFFSSDTAPECLITSDMLKRFTARDPKDVIGQPLTMRYAATTAPGNGVPVERVEAPCAIVGVINRDPSPMNAIAGQSGLMLPLGKALEISAAQAMGPPGIAAVLLGQQSQPGVRTYQAVTVTTMKASGVQDVEDKIKTLGFQAFSLNDALAGAKRAFLLLDIFLSLIGSIALAVSSLGIINTMVMSILERTREIGIMKAIGGGDGDIRRIFLIEAGSIGLIGGASGVAIGWLVGRVINAGANYYIVSQGGTAGNFFSLPFWLVGGAIGFSVAVSLLAGSFPAGRAARLDPIQALRHD